MHKEYMYLDNQVVISDEFGNVTRRDYHSRIFEQLQIENEIKVLEIKEIDTEYLIDKAKSKIRTKLECLTPFFIGSSMSILSYFYQLALTYSIYGSTLNHEQVFRISSQGFDIPSKLVLAYFVSVFSFSSSLALSVNRFGINNESEKDIEIESEKLKELKQEIIDKRTKLEKIINSANANIKLYKNYDVIDMKTKQFKKTR